MPVDPTRIPKGRSGADATADFISAVMESMERGFDRVTAAQERTELALVQLTGQVRELAKQQQKTADSIAEHLKLAQQQAKTAEAQSTNIAKLSKLCTVLAGRA